jgi:hypothetical protein
VALVQQNRQQTLRDIPRNAGEEDFHRGLCWGVHDGVFMDCKGREIQNGLKHPVNTPFPFKANELGKV